MKWSAKVQQAVLPLSDKSKRKEPRAVELTSAQFLEVAVLRESGSLTVPNFGPVKRGPCNWWVELLPGVKLPWE